MNKTNAIRIWLAGILIGTTLFDYVDRSYEIAVLLVVLVSLAVLQDMLRMCDRLLDPPPAIFRLFICSPRIFPEIPPHLLTVPRPQSDHQPHSLANAGNGRIRHNDKAT